MVSDTHTIFRHHLKVRILEIETLVCDSNKKSRIYVAALSKPKDRRQLSLPTALKLSVEQG